MIESSQREPTSGSLRLAAELYEAQRRRWLAGERIGVEVLLREHPSLAEHREAVVELIYAEYLLRQEWGEPVDSQDYFRRFPHFAEKLRRQFEVHRALADNFTGVQSADSAVQPTSSGTASGARREGDFSGTARFRVQQRIGAGGMGAIYRVYDCDRQETVALKTLRRRDAAALRSLKREFRALAGCSHRNLISLYELHVEGGQPFFTMELVDGCDLLKYVRGDSWRSAESTRLERPPQPPAIDHQASAADSPASLAGAVLARVSRTLPQLVDAVDALHGAGMLHRDLKPSNVLVSTDARVVVLDFGLAAEIDQAHDPNCLLGTAAYMSPEHIAGKPLSPASDWYSVGVMLHEALTGRRLFTGSVCEIFARKQASEPPEPARTVADVPRELNELCRDLLQVVPGRRPLAAEIRQRLGVACGPHVNGTLRATRPPVEKANGITFVGRDKELALLSTLFAEVQVGQARVCFLHGQSGIGKTALARQFLQQRAAAADSLCYASRCFERELLPFKAVDGLIDGVASELEMLPQAERRELLPDDVGCLLRVFPALAPAVDSCLRPDGSSLAPQEPARQAVLPESVSELRRQAFVSLRDLLGRLCEKVPLVVWVDDAQWSDPDSAPLLAELLRPPQPPRLLVIVSFRTADAHTPFVKALLNLHGSDKSAASGNICELTPLDHTDARRLAATLLAAAERASRDVLKEAAVDREAVADIRYAAEVEQIVVESQGHPYFLQELVEFHAQAQQRAEAAEPQGIASLDEAIQRRVCETSPDAAELLRVLSVAVRPLDEREAWRALGLPNSDRALFQKLQAGKLVRSAGQLPHYRLEVYHDRIRQAVVRQMTPDELIRWHERVAAAVAAGDHPDPETLAFHYREAGHRSKAYEHAVKAAGRAVQGLAFESAAHFYRMAIDLAPDDGAVRRELYGNLGAALANAGRGMESAAAYLKAIENAPLEEQVALRRHAGEQLMRAGRFEEGLVALEPVFEALAIRPPKTLVGVLTSLVLRQMRLKWQIWRFKPRALTTASKRDLLRIDTCRIAGIFTYFDYLRGAELLAQGANYAMQAGDLSRVAITLAQSACTAGGLHGGGRRAWKRFALAAEVVKLSDDPYTRQAMLPTCRSIICLMEGRWREAFESARLTEQLLRKYCVGVASEIEQMRLIGDWSAFYLGRLQELVERVQSRLHDGNERDDLFAASGVRTQFATVAWLVDDEAEEARRQVEKTIADWSHVRFSIQHFFALIGSLNIDLYSEDGRRAWQRLGGAERELRKSQLLRLPINRTEWLHFRIRSALAVMKFDGQATDLLVAAEADLRRLSREPRPWLAGIVLLLRAALASVRGERDGAIAGLERAAAALEQSDMAMHAAVARRRRGELLGGKKGGEIISEVDDWMRSQGVKAPPRIAALIAPGIWSL